MKKLSELIFTKKEQEQEKPKTHVSWEVSKEAYNKAFNLGDRLI